MVSGKTTLRSQGNNRELTPVDSEPASTQSSSKDVPFSATDAGHIGHLHADKSESERGDSSSHSSEGSQ